MTRDHGTKEATVYLYLGFEIKRRSNPSAAFAEMLGGIRSALREGGELAEAAKRFKGGTFIRSEDSVRLTALKKQGMNPSAFRVGTLAPELGPGLAFMYDAALEVLRSSDRRIRPDRLELRSAVRGAELAGRLVPAVGSASVAALEMARANPAFGERLKNRASELTGVMELGPPGPDPTCEHCTIVIEKEGEPPQMYCGTKSECDTIAGWFWLLLIILGVNEVLDWLF